MQKYLCLQRSVPRTSSESEKPSPSQMEAMYAKFLAWKDKYEEQIIDMGGKLGKGKTVTHEGVTDGPFIEAKEIIGGYMIVEAETIDDAIEIARESPGVHPNSFVEVREISIP